MKKTVFLSVLFAVVTVLGHVAFGRVYGGQVLYEIKVDFVLKLILTALIGAAVFTAALIYFKSRLYALTAGAIMLVFSFFILAFSSVKVYCEYKTNNYYEIAGAVQNFVTSDDSESFSVENVEFSYKDGSGAGYNTVQSSGGVISGDGRYIYIRYVKSGNRNIICYVENMV